MSTSYEVVKYDNHIPAKVLMQHKPGYRCNKRMHWHNELELVYMIKGEMEANISGKSSVITDGKMYFVNSREMHKTKTPEHIKINYYIVLLLSYDYLKQYYSKLDNVVFNVNTNADAQKKIINLICEIIPYAENKPSFYQLSISSRLSEIYRILLTDCMEEKSEISKTNSSSNIVYAKKAIEYIEEHYAEEISLGNISAYVGLTPTYFSNYFKKLTGSSFLHYLNNLRLEKALNNIVYNNMLINDAAVNNGFANVKSLISQCKKTYGCTPGEYKKQVKKDE